MLSDLFFSFRNLKKTPGFSIVAVLTLAVGIAAVVSIFAALRALVLEPFDYPDSHEMVQVWSGDGWPLSPADFLDLHAKAESFESFGVYNPQTFNVGAENAQAIRGVTATHGVLPAFAIKPMNGRWLEEGDAMEGAEPVAVVSYGLWQRLFGGREDLLGDTIRLNGGNVTVVGIMPKGFEFAGPWIRADECDVWMPMSLENDKDRRGSHWLSGVARLKDGLTPERADTEIKTIGKELSELYPNTNYRKKFLVRSLHFEMTKDIGEYVWLLFASVGVILLVACSNVASMLLSRGAQRQGEFGVRVALGATKGNLLRLAFAESLALALAGAFFGVFLAYGGIEIIKSIAPVSVARKEAMALDGPVLLFALGATGLVALAAGLPPVFVTMKTSVATILRNDARGAIGSRSRNYLLRCLVIAQIALAFVLANCAVIFSGSYYEILDKNKIITTDRVLTARITFQGDRYKEESTRIQAWEEIEQKLAAMPGVNSAGITTKLPLEGGSNTNGLINDEVYDPSQRRIQIEFSSVTEGYFESLGIKLLQGRNLDKSDIATEDGLRGVVINQTLADRAWPDENPLGKVIRANVPEDPWYTATVVGVVEDTRQWGADAEVQPEMFTMPKGHWGRRINVLVRTSQPANSLIPLLREVIDGVDPELALENIRTMDQVVGDATKGERTMAGLVNSFMGIALGLVAVGLYGTLSYTILLRTREIGVRRALGASGGEISRLVLRQGAVWVAIGLTIGLGGAFALAKVLESMVFGMEGLSLTPLVLAVAVIGAAAIVACWVPATRAARLDPLVALNA
ncbi:ABC transporter permease [Pelagicoccus mobilis]|uniref:ABC transporter permease n=1 Tax=Pelagicoccus mobilis TaxID=415221 RepID=A0A934RUI9_9BACT|nr:ABC transporter permease [Pelagicoccus mobilis]MBK1876673.1 ABC transporter permease [Pelagicoccus mobilis]